jgi:hypothetical protein
MAQAGVHVFDWQPPSAGTVGELEGLRCTSISLCINVTLVNTV